MDKVSYALGLGIGRQLSQMGADNLDIDDFAKAIKDILAGKKPEIDDAEAQTLVKDFFEKQEAKQRAAAAEKFKETKEKGEAYLAENAKKEGVVTLPSGLQYQVIKEGNGPLPKDTSLVKVNYEGKLIDGKVFDSSYKRKAPITMRANQVIKGWTEALTRMPAGSVWAASPPPAPAPGAREQTEIKPFSTLIFKIELLEVDPKK